jgi:apolipoprotein N-acyltransferase
MVAFWQGKQSDRLSPFTVLLLAASALAQAISVAWPWDSLVDPGSTLPWLQCFAMASLVAVLNNCRSPRQAALAGFWFTTVWLCGVFWWLYVALHTYAGLAGIVAAVAIASLAAALALYYAAACYLYAALRNQRAWLASLLFAALWTGAEMARGTWLTGFGWGASGYAHLDGWLAPYIPWLGAYGVTALSAWLAANLAQLRNLGRLTQSLSVLVLVAGVWASYASPSWTEPHGDLQVTLLQGNIPQDEKFEPGSGVPLALGWYAEQLQANRSPLVVAPETAIPLLPQQLPEGYWQTLQQRFETGPQAALIGFPLGSFKDGYTNSVLGFAPQATELWRYDKHHLVPFGEFIPPLFKWFTQMMNIPLGDFNRGALGQPSFAWAGQRLAANICYEDLFGEELATRFANPLEAPTIFVNISNIGWFGNSIAIDQHLNISRMRALEFERPFVRATNTGATVIMDHRARVTASLPRATRGVLEGQVQGREGMTPFAWWASRWGLWPVWLSVLGVVALAWYLKRRDLLSKE